MKIKHHTILNKYDKYKINWDFLRDDESEEHYFIPKIKDEFINLCRSQTNYDETIKDLVRFSKFKKADKIFSLGSGRACLEFLLKDFISEVYISDISKSIKTLKNFNVFDGAFQLDFFQTIKKLKNFNGVVLLSRIDTELEDEELIMLFSRLSLAEVKYIYFIPAQLITGRTFIGELFIRLKSFFLNKKLIFCGYSRSKKLLSSFWEKKYMVVKEGVNNSSILEIK